MPVERVEFNCQDVTLEGVLTLPPGGGPFGIVVVCHPHPLYGGCMDNNVVYAVCQGLQERGLASLRFNFRGVGKSTGHFAQGIGERDDARAAISFVKKREGIDPEKIGICGYSFGSMVAFPVAVAETEIKAAAGISPFVQPEDLLNSYTRPKLFLCGDQDQFIDWRELDRLVKRLPEPKEIKIFSGVDHFWWECEEQIAVKIGEFFSKYL